MRIGAGNIDLARFQRLAQRIEHRALEFRYSVANAEMPMPPMPLLRREVKWNSKK
jgi:hypothetical protein